MGIENGKIYVSFAAEKYGLKLDLFLVFISLIAMISSIIIDIYYPGTSWFGRSGALLVLFGALLELRQFKHQSAYNIAFQNTLISNGFISPIQPTQLMGSYKVVRIYTHSQIIIGTIIWGYGDLVIG